LVVVLAVGDKITALFINQAHPPMRVVHTISMVHPAEPVQLEMEAAQDMMPSTHGVLVVEAVRVVLDQVDQVEAPADLALAII
jgi:hypothetical protein